MIREPVRSSNLKAVGYDAATWKLEIEFQDGAVYQYDGVPPDVHAGLMQAPSHGSYFHRKIRDRYPYRMVP